jgi:hypothetical protein
MILMHTLDQNKTVTKRPAQQLDETLSCNALCGNQWSLKIGSALHTLFMIPCYCWPEAEPILGEKQRPM